MSKFNNPSRALAPAPPAPAPPRQSFRPEPSLPPAPTARTLAEVEAPPPGESPLVAIGFTAFSLLLISAMLNDWALMLFGGKAYLSVVMVMLTPALWLASGNALRAFRDKTGIAWLLLLALMLCTVPFSVWRSNSLIQILSYGSRSLCFYFYAASFTTSFKRCRWLMLVNTAVAAMLILACMKFGYADTGMDNRFQVRGSMFVNNSNDLALNLSIAMTEFVFLFYLKGIGKRLFGLAGILLGLFYMLKTGSRGCVLALAIGMIFTFLLSSQKVRMILIAIPLLVIAVVLMPASSAHRVMLIFQGSSARVTSSSDASALASQAQRQDLIQKSLVLTLQHPIFGVGMGQFVIAVMGEAAKKGQWAAALGTHNSYTQVSSECGIPALLCYVAIIAFSLKRSYQIYKWASGQPQFREVEGLAFSLLMGTLIYSIATFFFHIAYSGLLPLLSGEIMALETVLRPLQNKATRPARQQAPRVNLQPVPVQGV